MLMWASLKQLSVVKINSSGGVCFFFSAAPFSFWLPTYPFAGIKPFVVFLLRVKVALEAHLLVFLRVRERDRWPFIHHFEERVKVALEAHLLGTVFICLGVKKAEVFGVPSARYCFAC